MEALCEDSGKLIESYYDTCFSGKYTRDEESYEMIELARKHIVYDPGFIYQWGGLDKSITNGIMSDSGNYMSLIASMESAAKTAAENFVKEISK